MQTTITNDMAFGFPGEHANGQPFRADPYVASTEVEFGKPAFADGVTAGFKKAKKYDATEGATNTFIGVFVGSHEHIKFELPSDSHSVKVPEGTTVGVAAKGSWYIAPITGLASATTIAVGDGLKVSADGWAKADSGDTVVATVTEIDVQSVTVSGATTYTARCLVRLA